MEYNIHKICRVCLEEGALTSIYSTEFAMMPSAMMMMCAKVRVHKTDGLPAVICNNCIYRLGVAYHFKQECENSDVRLRQYLGIPDGYRVADAETNTDIILSQRIEKSHTFLQLDESDNSGEEDNISKKLKRRSRYQRKPPEEHKKRGPKPLPKLPQTCYECNKTFKCAAQLQMHIRTHSGEKPYACSYCPSRFAQKYNLRVHERTHTKERPFQCEICSKQFSALGNFQAHQKIHKGIRDHFCPICQKAFYSAGDLTKHMVIHTGIKNHNCDICGKAFSRQRDMMAHKRKLHSMAERSDDDDDDDIVDATEPIAVQNAISDHFKCPDCDKVFLSASGLSAHFRTHGINNNLLNLPAMTCHHYYPPQHPPSHPVPSHPHETLHPHATHHLSLNGPIPANHTTGMPVTHATMAHMLPPPPHLSHSTHIPQGLSSSASTPLGQTTLTMMHGAQRIHPY